MADVNEIALEAAREINDIFARAHASHAQRTARVQIAVRAAIERAFTHAEFRRQVLETYVAEPTGV